MMDALPIPSDTATNVKPLSVLERFRQLSRKKEEDMLAAALSPTTPFVTQSDGPLHTEVKQRRRAANIYQEGGRGRMQWVQRGQQRAPKESRESSTVQTEFMERVHGQMKMPASGHHGLQEDQVGITEYISSCAGFSGIIKQRFTDFIVNEIDPDGNVVKLTSFDLPLLPVLPAIEPDELLPKETWDKLHALLESGKKEESIMFDVTDLKKEERTAIHRAIIKVFCSEMASNTVDKDGKKYLQFRINNPKYDTRGIGWRARGGEFLHFVLYKENMDTTSVTSMLAARLRVKPNIITHAGTKDKRSVSTQRMCIKKVTADSVAKLDLRSVAIGNYSYDYKTLRLGQLQGNRFRIVLRHVEASDQVVSDALASLRKTGFINYFGLQRFGNSNIVPTHLIGKTLILGKWQEAVELILKPRQGESSYLDLAEARAVWWQSRDAKVAVKLLNRPERTIEGRLLLGLVKNGANNYLDSIACIPRNAVLLYLHSYQSLIWNKVVSRRIKEFGLAVLPGDLVPVDEKGTLPGVSVDLEADEDPSEKDEELLKGTMQVRTLSAEEAKNARIEDIVYPLPGYDIAYPDNATREWYSELLEQDGVQRDMLKGNIKLFQLYGTYRKMLSQVSDLTWRMLSYAKVNEDLQLTDLMALQTGQNELAVEGGPLKAVILEFSLLSSTYATMALREAMKCDTSVHYQASLSAAHCSTVTEEQQSENRAMCKRAYPGVQVSGTSNDGLEKEQSLLDDDVAVPGVSPEKKLKLDNNTLEQVRTVAEFSGSLL